MIPFVLMTHDVLFTRQIRDPRPRPDVTTAHFHALSRIFGGDRYCPWVLLS